ncbi:hypothetical protein [Candidatus Ulvibacter alkanivorans]|uniref:hypothetical protein n=1 Tax=Candidatus Ulvibacter alkanivorans TaxID=2267620 RepID=UPI000DF1DC37|nr:hypothetical protein [Candidatus Ulvibacter alkanivorans]
MMKDELDIFFKEQEGCFDIHETPSGHEHRFMQKLQQTQEARSIKIAWKKPLSIAASIAVLLFFGFTFFTSEAAQGDLASVSPEMEKTQSFFVTTINEELATLKSLEAEDTKVLVEDALEQLAILETEYDALKLDLVESGNDKRVVYAMISNFQSRIELLQHVIQTMEEIKSLKTNRDEITI